MSAFETIEARLELASQGFRAGIGDAVQSLGMLEGKAGGAHKAVGALGIGLAAVAAGGIAKSVSASMDLQSALTESQAIMGDLTQGEMKAMEQAAREVGKTTTFSAAEAGEAFYFLASAGMDAEQSVASMGDVAQFAQAGAFDLATATDLATDAQSALGMTAEDTAENAANLNQVMDVLVKSNTLANASVEEFSEALTNKAGAALKNTNKSIEEGAAVLAAYADQGIKGRIAGERLNIVLRDLQTASRENADAFEAMGVQVYDADGNMRNMADIIADVEDATAGMSTEQKNAALATLGLSQQAQDGITPLLGQSEAIREYEAELNDAGGTAEEVANNQLKSLSAQWEILKSQITDIGIGIGNVLLPPLTTLVGVVSTVVGAFSTFNDATDGMAGTVALFGTLFAGLAMAAGSLSAVIGAGGLATAVAAAGGALTGLGTALAILTGPIGLIIGAIALLAYAFYSDFGGIRTMTMKVVAVLRDELAPAFAWLKDVAVAALGLLKTEGVGLMATLEPIFARLVRWIGEHLIGAIRWLGQVVPPVFTAIKEAITLAIEGIRLVLGPFVEWLRMMWAQHGQQIVAQATETWGLVSEKIAAFVAFGIENISRFINWIEPFIMAGLDRIRRFWAVWGEDIIAHLKMAFTTLRIAVEGLIDFISTVIQVGLALIRGDWEEAWTLIKGFLQRTIDRIDELVAGWVDVIIGYIETFVTDAVDWFKDLYHKLVGGSIVPDMLADILAEFTNILGKIIDEIASFVGDGVQQFKDFASDALKALTDKVSDFRDAGASLIKAVGDGIRDNVPDVKGKVEYAAQKVSDYWPRSPAKEGPLSDIDKIGPGLIDEIVRGIRNNTGLLSSASEAAASAARGALDLRDLVQMPAGIGDTSRKTLDALQKQYGQWSDQAAMDAIRSLTEQEAKGLAESMEHSGYMWEQSAEAALDAIKDVRAGEFISQDLYDELGGGQAFGFLKNALNTPNPRGKVLAEDGSYVDPSFYGGQNQNPGRDGPPLIDFGNIDDDKLITVGELKKAAADYIKNEQRQAGRSSTTRPY